MNQQIAYLNGQIIPAGDLSISVSDAGFVLGATVTEQLRTFAGRVFRLNEHLVRLMHSLEIVGIKTNLSPDGFAAMAQEIVAHNHALLADGDDLGLSIFVTPGVYPTMAADACHGPTVCMHTYPLPFHLWAEKYQIGEHLAVSTVRQIPRECWPRDLKCRSRMHYYLAELDVTGRVPGCKAVLLDEKGFVTETSIANIVVYRENQGLISPPAEDVLPGVSLHVVHELADQIGLRWQHLPLHPDDLVNSDEVWLTSTPYCVLPVAEIDGHPIGNGNSGPAYQYLMQAWQQLAGVDIIHQAMQFANR